MRTWEVLFTFAWIDITTTSPWKTCIAVWSPWTLFWKWLHTKYKYQIIIMNYLQNHIKDTLITAHENAYLKCLGAISATLFNRLTLFPQIRWPLIVTSKLCHIHLADCFVLRPCWEFIQIGWPSCINVLLNPIIRLPNFDVIQAKVSNLQESASGNSKNAILYLVFKSLKSLIIKIDVPFYFDVKNKFENVFMNKKAFS